MGHAFHRKRMPINFGRTHGTGIFYEPPTQAPKPADPAAKEAAEQQLALAEATAEEQRRFEQAQIDTIVNVVSGILHQWKEAVDNLDQRLIDFPGWTAGDYCTLPVDEDVAGFYVDRIHLFRKMADWPLTLDNLDAIFGKDSLRREVPTERVVEKALQVVRPVARKCINHEGIDVKQFTELLTKRASRARQANIDLDSALGAVSRWMAEAFQEESSNG